MAGLCPLAAFGPGRVDLRDRLELLEATAAAGLVGLGLAHLHLVPAPGYALAVVGRARVDPEDDLSLRPSLPILFAVGDQDRLMPQDQLEEISARLTTKPEMHVLPGADHFLLGREMEVGDLVATFFQQWLPPQSQV